MEKKKVQKFKKPVERKLFRLYVYLDHYFHGRAHARNITPYLFQAFMCFWASDPDDLIKNVSYENNTDFPYKRS